jgi:hypothetical protein
MLHLVPPAASVFFVQATAETERVGSAMRAPADAEMAFTCCCGDTQFASGAQLRDPTVFEENRRAYLLYSICGEQGIAVAELTIR